MELRVFEIERFAVHDGPGIRTVVFLKGCGLHCPWCSNPESQSAARQLLRNEKKCAACGACARACPNGAVSWTPGEMPRMDRARCRACGACAAICPAGALSLCGELMTAEEIERVVLRDRDYYEDSGGGVTFSGGEAVLQAPALAPLLASLAAQGVHTAIETCGAAPAENFALVAPHTRLFLFDVKHAEEEKLRAVTGADIAEVGANLSFAAARTEVIARVPVIPGFNHTEAEMEGIFRFALSHGVRRVDLLPYHTLGRGKYAKLGREYALDAAMLTKEDLLPWKALGESLGLDVGIGG